MSKIVRILLCLSMAAVFSLATANNAEAQRGRRGGDWDRRDWDRRGWDRDRDRDWDRDGYWGSYWNWYDGYYRPYYSRRSFRPNDNYGYGAPNTYYYRPYQGRVQGGIQLGDFGIYWR